MFRCCLVVSLVCGRCCVCGIGCGAGCGAGCGIGCGGGCGVGIGCGGETGAWVICGCGRFCVLVVNFFTPGFPVLIVVITINAVSPSAGLPLVGNGYS